MTPEEFIANRRLVAEAREWILECCADKGEEDEVNAMLTRDIYRFIERNWAGGMQDYAHEMTAYHSALASFAAGKACAANE